MGKVKSCKHCHSEIDKKADIKLPQQSNYTILHFAFFKWVRYAELP